MHHLLHLPALLLLTLASSLSAATSATLIGPDLDPREVSIQSIRDGKISYFDEYRALQVKSLSDFIQIRDVGARARARPSTDTTAVRILDLSVAAAAQAGPLEARGADAAPLMVLRDQIELRAQVDEEEVNPPPAAEAPQAENGAAPAKPAPQAGDIESVAAPRTDAAAGTRVTVELTDGQRLVGQWLTSDAAGQTLTIRHELLGDVQISVEDLHTLEISTAGAPLRPHTSDQVMLQNGDVLAGFITALHHDHIELQPLSLKSEIRNPKPQTPDPKPESLSITLDRLSRLRLANPRVEPAANRALLWLDDDSRVLVDQLEVSAGSARFRCALAQNARTESRIPDTRLRRIDLPGALHRLRDLADLPVQADGTMTVLGAHLPPRVQSGMILMQAPARLEFQLPPAAERLALHIALDPPAGSDPALLPWANCILVVSLDDHEAAQHTLSAARPQVDLNLPAKALTLTIELQEGAGGPVMDFIRISDAILLVAADATKP